MGRESRARVAREFVVRIRHDNDEKKTQIEYKPDDPVAAAHVLNLALAGVLAKLQRKPPEEAAPPADGVRTPLIHKPTGVDRLRVEKTRTRGTS